MSEEGEVEYCSDSIVIATNYLVINCWCFEQGGLHIFIYWMSVCLGKLWNVDDSC
jgi:hypothetical protein